MDLKHLSSFLAVAEELHFGRAAERLHLSQPPLSRQIMDLEEELGVALFVRGPKGVSMTPAGRYLVKEAEMLLGRVAQVKERIASIGGDGQRHIRIGFVASAMYSFLPELIDDYCRELPALSFEFVELASNAQARALLNGSIDIGFVRSWIHEERVRFVPMAEEGLSLARSARIAPPEGAGDLARYARLPFIAFSKERAPGLADLAQAACARAGFSPKTVFTAGQFDSVLRLVAAGLGWSIVPTMALSGSRLEVQSSELLDVPDRFVVGVALRQDEDDRLVLRLLEIAERHFSTGLRAGAVASE